MKPESTVIDYGMGNLRSVAKALELAGANVTVTDNHSKIKKAQALILPGVGSFHPAIEYLRRHGLDTIIKERISEGVYFLGLCLGFQLLFDTSKEGGTRKGLGVIPGQVLKFNIKNPALKVPHMGWNTVTPGKESAKIMFKNIPENSYFYFVHSYYGRPKSSYAVGATTNYGTSFCSAIFHKNIWACQFHPEKSGGVGIQLLKNFVNESKRGKK